MSACVSLSVLGSFLVFLSLLVQSHDFPLGVLRLLSVGGGGTHNTVYSYCLFSFTKRCGLRATLHPPLRVGA